MESIPSPGRALQPLRSLRHHLRLSLTVALLVALAGLPLAWIKGRSQYAAEAVFQVSPNFQKNVSVDKELELQSNSQYREFVNHLSRSVLRYDVLQRALTTMRENRFDPCLPAETERRCIERLQRAVFVLPVADTYMVRVGLRSDHKAEPHQVINAIMAVFLDTTRTEQIFGSDDRARVLVERRDTLRAEVDGFARQRDALAARLGLTTFGENTANPYDTTLAQMREKVALATLERSQAQAALAAFDNQRETPLSAGRSVLEMRLQDTGLQVLRNEVTKRSEELSRTVAGLEERHPARSPALSEQSEIQQRLQSRESAFEKNAQQNVRARLTATLQQAQQVEREARERLRDLESQAGSFAANFREAMRLTAEMRKRDQELQELRDRLNFLNAERQAIGFVRLVSAALPAETPQGIGRLRLMAMILLAALGLGLALPTLIDLLDRRVLAPRDAERALGIGAAGWIVDRRGAANQLLAADQTRRLASMLLRQCKRGPRRVFGFTSARVGGGTTALVHELAHVLGQLGSRVLVVDTNTLQTRAGAPESAESTVPEGPTLADLLAGRATPDAVVHTVERDGRSVALVPCGATPDSGIERVDRLREALDHWSTQWDIVLVDVAPLLPSADAELLIDTLGQVFLVVEAGNVPKGDVVRARAALQRLDPEAVGLIVTRVPPAAAGVQAHQIEAITGDRFDRVVQHSWLQLQWELLRTRWARMRAR